MIFWCNGMYIAACFVVINVGTYLIAPGSALNNAAAGIAVGAYSYAVG